MINFLPSLCHIRFHNLNTIGTESFQCICTIILPSRQLKKLNQAATVCFIFFLVGENEGDIIIETETSDHPEASVDTNICMEPMPRDEDKSCQTSADLSQYTPRKKP